MNFDLDEEQRALREHVINFAQRELTPGVLKPNGESTFSRAAWKKCAELGIQGLLVPTEYGGTGAPTLTFIVAMEALGYACHDNGFLFSLNAQILSSQHLIVRFGSDSQKRRYLPDLCSGSLIAAHGMSEPGSGSDAFSLATTARRDGDSYVLQGSKTFVTNAPIADVFLIFATVDSSKGFAGICAFLVERDSPGLTVAKPLHKMGLRSSPMAEVFLDECRVPAGAMLGKQGAGMSIFNTGMERERSLILASALGTMQRNLERAVQHARERRQFGHAIGKFQAVSHRIVDMKLRLETARLLMYRLGWLIDHGRPIGLDSALAKLYLSECFLESSQEALRVFGGYGFMDDYEIEADVRDAFGGILYSGTSDIQRSLAARYLGL